MSSIEQRIRSAKMKLEELDVPEWGGTIYVRRLSSGERDVFFAAIDSAKNEDSKTGVERLIVSLALCDENGKAIFSSPDELKDLDAIAIDNVSLVAMRINAFTKEAKEDLAKKSQSGEMPGLNTSSPNP